MFENVDGWKTDGQITPAGQNFDVNRYLLSLLLTDTSFITKSKI